MHCKNISIFSFIALLFTSAMLSASHCMYMATLKGQDISPHVNEITDLALVVYRDYPYLYEGTEEEYLPAIEYYTHSSNGTACILFDQSRVIGVAIGMPMNEMRDKYKLPLLDARPQVDFDRLFYLGELLLLDEYRGQGLGKQLYLSFENSVIEQESFNKISFCKIDESQPSSSAPPNYKPLDGFWNNLGYEKCDDVTFSVDWINVSETEDSPHTMVYWIKSLH